MASFERDVSSFANVEDWITNSLHLDLHVDFEQKQLTGSVTLQMHCLRTQPNVSLPNVILDTRSLSVSSALVDGQPCSWEMGNENFLGSPLTIHTSAITQEKEDIEVKIVYSTDPGASALQWLSPMQTAGKVHPYLFTQCQAIHARSLVPCQDTPFIKIVYTAAITVPHNLVALMSAIGTGSSTKENTKTYTFKQPVKIPSYLLALVVGDLHSKEIGPRSAVWSERAVIEQAAHEFDGIEQFIKAGEDLCGPYVWGRLDLLVLPPSFPYGGMENPCLTFVTPTLLAGDRSLVNVVIHEIAHSWSGNLVTTASWAHFWLNEGFTVFVERKIVERAFGAGVKGLHAAEGRCALNASIAFLSKDHPSYTALVPDLNGVDPDDAFSSVPYEKGYTFLSYLQELAGGPDVFNRYLAAHFAHFAHKSITTAQWKEFMLQYFAEHNKETVFDSVDWDAWLYAPGPPPQFPSEDESLLAACDVVVKDVLAGSAPLLDHFTAGQKVAFFKKLADAGDAVTTTLLANLNRTHSLGAASNAEVLFAWLSLCLQRGWVCEEVTAPLVQFVTSQGRMKFVRPLYRLLAASGEKGRALALATFQEQKGSYHNIAATMISKDLGLK